MKADYHLEHYMNSNNAKYISIEFIMFIEANKWDDILTGRKQSLCFDRNPKKVE